MVTLLSEVLSPNAQAIRYFQPAIQAASQRMLFDNIIWLYYHCYHCDDTVT